MERRLVTVFILTLLTFGIIAAPAWAQQPMVLRIAHTGGVGAIYDLTATQFASRVSESLRGRVEIKTFPRSQLGSDEQVIRGIKIGAPEMAIISTVMETAEPKFGVFEMPYLIVNRAQVKRA